MLPKDYDDGMLKSLTGSTLRAKILLALDGGPKLTPELVALLEAPASTVLHAARPMIDGGIIVKRSDGYNLTNIGRIETLLLVQLVDGLIALKEYADFWQSHDLSGIPTHLRASLGMLTGGRYIRDDKNTLMQSQAFFVKQVSQAKHIFGVSPIIAPGYAEMVSHLLDSGAAVSLILTKEIIDIISPATIKSWQAYEGFCLHEVLEARVAFTVADNCIFLGLYNLDGTYDTVSDLVCCGQKAASWGISLYEYYLKQSRRT